MENQGNSTKGVKRKFEPSILDSYNKLTNNSLKIRVKNGANIVKYLDEIGDREIAETELKYALERTIRGLGSSKLNARCGFFSTLVALLNYHHEISVDKLFELIQKELHKAGSNSKSENADVSSGQILACGAVLRSNLFERSSNEDKTKLIRMLLNAGCERTYLTLGSYLFLIDLFNKVEDKEFEKIIFPVIKPEILKKWPEQTLDTLYFLFVVQQKYPNMLKTKLLRNSLGTSQIVCLESVPALCQVLTTLPRVTALKHPIFHVFTDELVKSAVVVEFFEEIDRILVKNNRNKFLVVTLMLTKTVENLSDPSKLPKLLTVNYIQQMLNTFKTAVGKYKDKEFQQVCHKLFEAILKALKDDGIETTIKLQVLKKLLFFPGTFIFEKVTKSKLIQHITMTLNCDGVKELGEIYRDVVLNEYEKLSNDGTSEKWWNMDRLYAARLLMKLLNHPSIIADNEWKIEQFIFLMKYGLLENTEIGSELADNFKETFLTSLELKQTKLEDLQKILYKLVNELNCNIRNLRIQFNENELELWHKTMKLLKKIDKKKHKTKLIAVFNTLFLHMIFQMFNNVKLATDSLNELFNCYERIEKKTKNRNDDDDDDLLWIEVVVDLFLNLLSHNSHLLRFVINCVFPHLCEYLNTNGLRQILDVLDPNSEVNPLERDDDDDDDEMDDETENSDEDVESSSDDDDNDEDDTVNDRLKMALHQVLGQDSDQESIDVDDLCEEDGMKLDDALAQTFKQFKLGRNINNNNNKKTKKQNRNDQMLTHFRVRVLDLIEIYLNSTPSMLHALEIIVPLLQILEFCVRNEHQKPLQDRVKCCLKKLYVLKKFRNINGVDVVILADLLASLLDKGTKNSFLIQDMSEQIGECCVFIINCAQILNGNEATHSKKCKIVVAIKRGLKDFFQKRDCLIPVCVFKSILQLNWIGILYLLPDLMEFVFSDTVRPFRRNQSLELLKLFYSNCRFINSHKDDMVTIMKQTNIFVEKIVEFFKNLCTNPRGVREKFVGGLFGVLAIIKSSPIGDQIDGDVWNEIAEVVRDYRSRIALSTDAKLSFSKLCKSLKVSNIVKMKI